MGFVDDDSDSEAEANTLVSQADEEALVVNGDELNIKRQHSYGISSPTDLRTPMTKNNNLLNVTRLRRKGITESEEIWEELEDGTLTELSPSSRRRISAQTASSHRPKSRESALDSGPDETTSLIRSGTGRSYRNIRQRRSAASMSTHERVRRRRSAGSQEALGGWWKMRRWFSGPQLQDKGDEPRDSSGNDNGNGNGASTT